MRAALLLPEIGCEQPDRDPGLQHEAGLGLATTEHGDSPSDSLAIAY